LETTVKSKVLQEFQEAADTLVNPELKKWMDQGGKVIALFCSCGPEEIVTAAGAVPMRARGTGSTGTELADAYLASIICSFTRHSFNMGLRGEYDFLEGAIWCNTCDHCRRVYDNWKRKVKTPFVHILSLPKKTGEPQVAWYRDEMVILKEGLEKHLGITITDDKLREAIKTHNETRRLQRQLYELRKKEHPPITGAETLAVIVAGTAMPKERYNQMLKELLQDLKGAEGIRDYRARLMITGGILDDPNYIKVIEDQGGLVVTDMLCFGTRILWKDVDEKADDPLQALAQFYIADRLSCPRMFQDYPRRLSVAKDMIRDFKVDGIIGERLLFCDLWTVEHYQMSKEFKPTGIPYMQLDREYVLGGIGQMRTRVQAFLETLGR